MSDTHTSAGSYRAGVSGFLGQLHRADGIVSGTYGSSTTSPVITVDANGTITSVTSTAIAAPGAIRDWMVGFSSDGAVAPGYTAQQFQNTASSLTNGDMYISLGVLYLKSGHNYCITVMYGSDVLPSPVLQVIYDGVSYTRGVGQCSVTTIINNNSGADKMVSYNVSNAGADYNVINFSIYSF